MTDISFEHRLKRLFNKVRSQGLTQAWRSVTAIFKPSQGNTFPLANANKDLIFASSTSAIKDFARNRGSRPTKEAAQQRNLEDLFPKVFQGSNNLSMRYAFFPSLENSKGLVVVFHGYLGFEIDQLRYSWKHFDLLLPLDNFGWKNLGAWFWGEQGQNKVEVLTHELIDHVRSQQNSPRWFAVGASMGGFAALFHGVKYGADGVYVMTPILDVRGKIRDYRSRDIQTSYTALAASTDTELKNIPDIYAEAKAAKTLPPLYLIQNQYDRSNPFGRDTLPLLSLYAEKNAWHGLRVQPSIGHQGHDGSYAEAQYFFDLIASKSPPRVVDFYDQE